MAIKAVVVDLDGTLLREGTTQPVAGAVAMLERLCDAGVQVAIATNRDWSVKRVEQAGLPRHLILDRGIVGARKGSPRWAKKACREFGVESHELAWLGDGETDMTSALNANVIYFHAAWSRPDYAYGIHVDEPEQFATIILECFAKTSLWYMTYNATDALGRSARSYAMMNPYDGGLGRDLIKLLKEGTDPLVGKSDLRLGEFMRMHLFGSIYAERLHEFADLWTVYPGHLRGGTNDVLDPIARLAGLLFRDKFMPLLVRHTDASDSGLTRKGGGTVKWPNQITTVHANPRYTDVIVGKRIVVIDDFEKDGFSHECARNLLLAAGAAEVVAVSVGKYSWNRYVYHPVEPQRFDPFHPIEKDDVRWWGTLKHCNEDSRAAEYFRLSHKRFGDRIDVDGPSTVSDFPF